MTSNKNLGNAGEFYVLAQLAQRGYIAGKTDDGQTLIDVIATEPETLTTVNIQVKATGNYDKVPSWIMSKKNEDVFESFRCLPPPFILVLFWVVLVVGIVVNEFDKWVYLT